MWSLEEITSSADLLVVARRSDVLDQFLEHRGVDGVARLRAVEAQQGDTVAST